MRIKMVRQTLRHRRRDLLLVLVVVVVVVVVLRLLVAVVLRLLLLLVVVLRLLLLLGRAEISALSWHSAATTTKMTTTVRGAAQIAPLRTRCRRDAIARRAQDSPNASATCA